MDESIILQQFQQLEIMPCLNATLWARNKLEIFLHYTRRFQIQTGVHIEIKQKRYSSKRSLIEDCGKWKSINKCLHIVKRHQNKRCHCVTARFVTDIL